MSSVLMWLCLVCCVVSKSTQAWILPSPWHVHWLVMIISPARLPLVLSNWGTYSITSKSFPYLNLVVFFYSLRVKKHAWKLWKLCWDIQFLKDRKINKWQFYSFLIILFYNNFILFSSNTYLQVYMCVYALIAFTIVSTDWSE